MNTEEQIQYLKVMQDCINNTKVTVTICDIGFDSSSKPLYNAIVNLNNYQEYIMNESNSNIGFKFNFKEIEIASQYNILYKSIDKIIHIIYKKILNRVKTISKSESFKDKKKKAIIYYAEQSMHRTFNSISKKYKKLGFSPEEIETMCKKYIDRAIIKKVLE